MLLVKLINFKEVTGASYLAALYHPVAAYFTLTAHLALFQQIIKKRHPVTRVRTFKLIKDLK